MCKLQYMEEPDFQNAQLKEEPLYNKHTHPMIYLKCLTKYSAAPKIGTMDIMWKRQAPPSPDISEIPHQILCSP